MLIWLAFWLQSGAGVEIVVSPQGLDSNPGTREAPLATPARARDLARERRGKGPVVILLRGGTYALAEPLRFLPAFARGLPQDSQRNRHDDEKNSGQEEPLDPVGKDDHRNPPLLMTCISGPVLPEYLISSILVGLAPGLSRKDEFKH